MEDTKIRSYEEIVENISITRLQVYRALKELEYANNLMIAKKLNWSINRVTGRTKELRDAGIIKVSHQSWCPYTRKKVNYMTVVGRYI